MFSILGSVVTEPEQTQMITKTITMETSYLVPIIVSIIGLLGTVITVVATIKYRKSD